jgi:hypothetical protein
MAISGTCRALVDILIDSKPRTRHEDIRSHQDEVRTFQRAKPVRRQIVRATIAWTRLQRPAHPYNYCQPAGFAADLSRPELTRCSMSPVNCHVADGCGYEISGEAFRMLRAFTRVQRP